MVKKSPAPKAELPDATTSASSDTTIKPTSDLRQRAHSTRSRRLSSVTSQPSTDDSKAADMPADIAQMLQNSLPEQAQPAVQKAPSGSPSATPRGSNGRSRRLSTVTSPAQGVRAGCCVAGTCGSVAWQRMRTVLYAEPCCALPCMVIIPAHLYPPIEQHCCALFAFSQYAPQRMFAVAVLEHLVQAMPQDIAAMAAQVESVGVRDHCTPPVRFQGLHSTVSNTHSLHRKRAQ